MAASARRGGDRVLESRHLVGLFLGVVLLCGVFFTLGYVMGRTQYGGSVHAETIARRPAPSPRTTASSADAAAVPAPAPSEWDFYKNNPTPPSSIPAKSSPAAAENAVTFADAPPPPAHPAVIPTKARIPAPAPPRLAKASILVQVAALRHESDAVEMARLLRQKHFPSFVSSPLAGETLYRVQVGPYLDERAADAAKAALDRAGFKAIIKR